MTFVIQWTRLTRRNGFDYPEAAKVDQYYPQYYHKTDNDGRPVYIEQLGKLDINALYKITTQERQLKHLVSEYEQFLSVYLPACSAEKNKLVETSCTILDLHNAGISTFYKGRSISCNQLISSQGLRLCCLYYRPEQLPRDHGLHVHHQRALPLLHGVVARQAVARRGYPAQDSHPRQKLQD